jgi:hypothetical protein
MGWMTKNITLLKVELKNKNKLMNYEKIVSSNGRENEEKIGSV